MGWRNKKKAQEGDPYNVGVITKPPKTFVGVIRTAADVPLPLDTKGATFDRWICVAALTDIDVDTIGNTFLAVTTVDEAIAALVARYPAPAGLHRVWARRTNDFICLSEPYLDANDLNDDVLEGWLATDQRSILVFGVTKENAESHIDSDNVYTVTQLNALCRVTFSPRQAQGKAKSAKTRERQIAKGREYVSWSRNYRREARLFVTAVEKLVSLATGVPVKFESAIDRDGYWSQHSVNDSFAAQIGRTGKPAKRRDASNRRECVPDDVVNRWTEVEFCDRWAEDPPVADAVALLCRIFGAKSRLRVLEYDKTVLEYGEKPAGAFASLARVSKVAAQLLSDDLKQARARQATRDKMTREIDYRKMKLFELRLAAAPIGENEARFDVSIAAGHYSEETAANVAYTRQMKQKWDHAALRRQTDAEIDDEIAKTDDEAESHFTITVDKVRERYDRRLLEVLRPEIDD